MNDRLRSDAAALREGLQRVLFGQEDLVELTLCGLLAGGHLLLEGLPGLGKTELVKGLARLTGLSFKRAQFTPDLLPGDITGSQLLDQSGGSARFVFQPGPLFANLVLADEINRAGPKTQSALLEAMQERSVTVGGETHWLPEPFFVLATQNPIELEGTYPLPEAQLDRFLFKIPVIRPSVDVIRRIIAERPLGSGVEVSAVTDTQEVLDLIAASRAVRLPASVIDFIARLVEATHSAGGVRYGAGPRAGIALAAGAKALAFLRGRGHGAFEDVRHLAVPVLAHRIQLEYGAKLEGLTPEGIVASLAGSLPAQAVPEPALMEAVS